MRQIAESSDDENGDTYSQAIEAGDEKEDELLMEVLTHQPTEEDFVRWEEKYKNSKWIKEVTSDEDDEPIRRSWRLEKKNYWQGGSQRQPWTETLKDKRILVENKKQNIPASRPVKATAKGVSGGRGRGWGRGRGRGRGRG